MAKLLSCVLGPRLYRVHRPRLPGAAPGGEARGEPAWDSYYQPRGLEKHTDSVLALASVLWSISCYASPLALLYLYRKGLLTMSRVVPLSHCAATLGLLLAGVACLRGLGRWSNPQYLEFIAVLEESHRSGSADSRRKLGLYTFDFRSWPVDFRWDSAGPAWGGARAVPLLPARPRGASRGLLGTLRNLPGAMARLLLAHTLGRRMLFPGSVRLLQRALLPALLQGQARLIEQVGAPKCPKFIPKYPQNIPKIFVDFGGSDPLSPQVICCEGNAGFYEVGCLSTPLEAGYSVLGWNHPGFGGSTVSGGYPKIVVGEGLEAVREWLEAATPEEEGSLLRRCRPDERRCRELLEAFAGQRRPPFPWAMGEELSPAQRRQLALYLAQRHLQNFEASHCT
uniref:phosphatidylserine lipase ABHD16A n=1 Tax=Lonchura striata TaxID=40157 RepID=UPI000B4CD4CE